MENCPSTLRGKSDGVLESLQPTGLERDVTVHCGENRNEDNNSLKNDGTASDDNFFQSLESDVDRENLQSTNQELDNPVHMKINDESDVLNDNLLVDLLSRNSEDELEFKIRNNSKTKSEIDFVVDVSKETCEIRNDHETATDIEIISEFSKSTQGSVADKVEKKLDLTK